MRSRFLTRLRQAFRRLPGPWGPKYDLLRNEVIRAELEPHPLSFLDHHAPFIYLLGLGLGLGYLFNAVGGWNAFEDFMGYLPGVITVRTMIWAAALVAFGVATSVMTIRWSVLFIYGGIIAFAIFLIVQSPEAAANPFFLSVYSIIMSLLGMALVDAYRRTHDYVITDMRIILKAGIFTRRERTVRFENVTDLETRQGILGRIFGYGSIIPLTASGIGTGSDEAFAAGGIGATSEGGVSGGVLAGGGRGVTVARARTNSELRGIYPYRKVRTLIHQLLQEHSMVYYAKEQRDLLREMRDMMSAREEPDYYFAQP